VKKFVKKVIFFLSFSALFAIVISYTIDPYNVFHWKSIRNNGLEPNKNYIKTKYIIENPDRYDGYLLGSSRVGSIHVENIPNLKIYNMTYSVGLPEEHYKTLKTFVDNNVNIDIVYMGVDSLSYTENPEDHYTQALRAPYQYLEKWQNLFTLYIDPTMACQSLPQIISSLIEGKDIDGIDVVLYIWLVV
jgi:hypothetical protein